MIVLGRPTSQLIRLYVAWYPWSNVLTLYYGLLYGSNAVFKSCMCLTYTWLLFRNTCFSKSYLFTINNISHNARQFLFFSMDSKTGRMYMSTIGWLSCQSNCGHEAINDC